MPQETTARADEFGATTEDGFNARGSGWRGCRPGDTVAGVLLNAATGRWHPVAFTTAPLPGSVEDVGGFMRFRSRAHHTEGFATEREADEHIASTPGWVPSGAAWEWDGDGVPAMTVWFLRADDGRGEVNPEPARPVARP